MVAVNDNMFEIYSYSILIVLHAEMHGLFKLAFGMSSE